MTRIRDQYTTENAGYDAYRRALVKHSQSRVDKDYVAAIDSLIPQAIRVANNVLGADPPSGTLGQERVRWRAQWDRAFHGEMDRLALECGIRRMSHQQIAPTRSKRGTH